MRSEILLHWSSCLELIAWSDDPEPCWRVRGYPAVDPAVLVVTRVLILVVHLHMPRVYIRIAKLDLFTTLDRLGPPRRPQTDYLASEEGIARIRQQNCFRVIQNLASFAVFTRRHDPLSVIRYCHVLKPKPKKENHASIIKS